MNAISKGVALNIFPNTRPYTLAAADASPHGAQPYVTLLSRRVPLLQTAAGTWRALALSPSAHAGPAPPGAAHAYIARALKHTAPAVLGALRLLAASYADADALNRDGWALYAAFRPAVDGWGQRGEVRCATILGLRKQSGRAPGAGDAGMRKGLVEFEEASEKPGPGVDAPQAAEASGVKDEPDPTLSDDDALFDDTFTAEDLSHLP